MNELIRKTNKQSLLWMGLLVIGVGMLWLLQKMNIVEFPYWMFTWKAVLIIIGILIGIQSKFRGFTWVGFIVTGGVLILSDIPGIGPEMRHYTLPILVIYGGIMLVLRALFKKGDESLWSSKSGFSSSEGTDDYLDITAIFGGSKRKIITKDFKGGEIVGIFGGAELDFTQADLTATTVLDATCIFGGLKIIVPANWEVKSNMVTIFGGVDDKRKSTASENNKTLVLTGFCMFGGVDIRSY